MLIIQKLSFSKENFAINIHRKTSEQITLMETVFEKQIQNFQNVKVEVEFIAQQVLYKEIMNCGQTKVVFKPVFIQS